MAGLGQMAKAWREELLARELASGNAVQFAATVGGIARMERIIRRAERCAGPLKLRFTRGH